ncbi:16383_t:CDS:2, partial [Dentiscutata erythropus]
LEKPFDTTTKWTKTDTHCFNIITPEQNTALDPNDRVYITWKMLKECYELVKESLENINNEQSNKKFNDESNKFETSTPTLITPLTNKTFNEDEDEFSGVVGPFGINPEAAKFPKTLFAPVPTKTENKK